MHIDRAAPARPFGGHRLVVDYGRLTRATFAGMVFCGAIALVEPSPYDFASFIAMAVWFCGGFTLDATGLLFIGLIAIYNFGGFVSLVPHLDEPLPVLFMLQSLYLAITAVFFVLFFADDARCRAEMCLAAFTASTVLAALCGIVGYFDIAHLGAWFSMYGRASGTFKDPNVLGSYLIMGALALMQRLMLDRSRRRVASAAALGVIVIGIFLSFSRGSWGAFAVATPLLVVLTFATAEDRRTRRRIVLQTALAGLAVAILLGLLLSFASTREFFVERAAVTQDYDVGDTGRFGNQLRSLPLLLDRLNGFGPLRFRLTFGLDPHNSYINAFASYGWLGACAFFLLVGLTFFIGFRLAIVTSPYRRVAQVFWPALMVFLVQGLQIDIDHWRHVYLMLGAVWGLESARRRWASQSTAVRYAATRDASTAWSASTVPVMRR